ncbi:MAG: hypothetical protein AAFX93_02725 [Verrucomicrobiota bacterium]
MSVETRIRRLQVTSPFYAQQLTLNPDWIDWLDKPKNRDFDFRYCALEELWARECQGADFSLAALRRFRRRMSLRIAYRELNGLARIDSSWQELTLLAEFVLHRLCEWRFAEMTERSGLPLNNDLKKPARYCIFALGKLGAGELNFCSDLDLIYCYDGDGQCLKNGQRTALTTREFFDRFFRQVSADLTAPNSDGVLYHLDLRLRPEGDAGPLIRTAQSLTSYYWEAGQTWERLAWLRGRPVAGSEELGQSILEELNAFRYPRFPPANLTREVAGVKMRTENEIDLDELDRDIKTGTGGIREIEFIAHSLQLIHGGKNPFLQTHSTVEALRKLSRYGVLSMRDAQFLDQAYRWLRQLENCLQMRGETPRHCLPKNRDDLVGLAESMNLESPEVLVQELTIWRQGIHDLYSERFPDDPHEHEIQDWTAFLAGEDPRPTVRQCIDRWFPDTEEVDRRVRTFVLGDSRSIVTRARVARFLDLSTNFDRTLPRLADPMRALERVGRFAECYGARQQFFIAAANPSLFRSLSLLFDRSSFVFDLLCRHPGIMEELLHEAPRRLKSSQDCQREIQLLKDPTDEDAFVRRLWLYVKAEQVRMAIAELLHGISIEAVSWALSQLAEAVIRETLAMTGVGRQVGVIALGKFGGEELSLGSDLDLLLLSKEAPSEALKAQVKHWCAIIGHNPGLGPTFELDLRLRPYGDVGPQIVTLDSLKRYHQGGHARLWERQMLVRARPIAGCNAVRREFFSWHTSLLYTQPPSADEIEQIWMLRFKIESEKSVERAPAEYAFKTGPGGLLDLEFLAQLVSLKYGFREPDLRQPCVHTCLLAAKAKRYLDDSLVDCLLRNWNLLRNIEFQLRRKTFRPVVALPKDEAMRRSLARWIGISDPGEFWQQYNEMLSQNRSAFVALFEQFREGVPNR